MNEVSIVEVKRVDKKRHQLYLKTSKKDLGSGSFNPYTKPRGTWRIEKLNPAYKHLPLGRYYIDVNGRPFKYENGKIKHFEPKNVSKKMRSVS